METDLLFWILAANCFVVAAYGTHRTSPSLTMFGWIGLVLAALTFIT